jgi:glycerol-3-phosphate dehydrogenase
MSTRTDVLIIGGGIVGVNIARYLSKSNLHVSVIEKGADVASGTSCANSATIHAGHSIPPNTVKAKFCVQGFQLWHEIAAELDIKLEQTGDYVLCFSNEELEKLPQLIIEASYNCPNLGRDLTILSQKEMIERQPNVNPEVLGSLYSPKTCILEPVKATVTLADNAKNNGVEFLFNTKFQKFKIKEGRVIGVETSQGFIECNWVINASGLHSDEIMQQLEKKHPFAINGRKSTFILLDGKGLPTTNLLSPMPSQSTKGISVKPMLDTTDILVGANAKISTNKEDLAITPECLKATWAGGLKLIPSLEPSRAKAVFVGYRATGNHHYSGYTGDFLIEQSACAWNVIHIGGIDSPGLTSAPVIALNVARLLKTLGLKLRPKSDWKPSKISDRFMIEQRVECIKRNRYQLATESIVNSLR